MIDPPHVIESNGLAMRAAAAACREPRFPPPPPPRRTPPEPPQRQNSRLSSDSATPTPSPATPLSPQEGLTKNAFPAPPTLLPNGAVTPLTPPTPQGPGPGQSILGTSLEDEFTRVCRRFSFLEFLEAWQLY